MTLAYLSDNILNIGGGLLSSDDNRLISPQIDYWIHQYRAKYIMQAIDYGKDIPNETIQDLGLWELESLDKAEDSTLVFGQKVLRTVNPLPKFIEMPQNRGIFIGSTNKQIPFVMTTPRNALYKAANTFAAAAGVFYVYMINQYAYVINCCNDNSNLKWVNVQGVLEDPTMGSYYLSDGNGIPYNRNTSQYPMPESFADLITKQILQTELSYAKTTYDPTNDASGDEPNKPQSKQGESK